MANVCNVLKLALKVYEGRGLTARSDDTQADYVMANWIVELLDNHAANEGCYVEIYDSRDVFESELDGTDGHDCNVEGPGVFSSEEASEKSTSEYEPSSPKRSCTDDVPTDYRKQAVQFWLNESGRKRRSLSTVRAKYKLVKSIGQLRNWKKRPGPCRYEFKLVIYERLFENFLKARQQNISVHDDDLKDWALQIASDVGNQQFIASARWIANFKKANRIISRKITKFVSRRYMQDRTLIATRIENFLRDVKPKIDLFSPNAIYNADQSGFEKEMRAKRTLALKGSKHVEAAAQSIHTYDSYTIMPVISMNGELFPKLYICLQETGGGFGPRVLASMVTPRNLVIDSSSSGKMTKHNLEHFYREAFFPNTAPSSLLLVDSWSAHKDSSLLERVTPEGKALDVAQIPPGTTGEIQPLDREFFRQWKAFYRLLTEKIVTDRELSIDVYRRDSILKLQSCVHYQFSSPKFSNLIRYAWYAAHYTNQRPGTFVTPATFCFVKTQQNCEVPECQSKTLFRCGWCKVNLCFNHSTQESHFCDLYVV